MAYLDEKFTKLPEERDVVVQPDTGTPPVETASAQPTTPIETPITQPPAQAPETQKPDEFIENLNKRYTTQYKTDDEIKNIFELPKKVTEYENRLRDAEGYKTKATEYEKQIEELKNNANSEFLSKPLIRNAYVAQQLQERHPNHDPDVLLKIAMSDVNGMDSIEAIANAMKLRLPKTDMSVLKAVVLDDLGLKDVPKEEWDDFQKAKIELRAADARDLLNSLKVGIEFPKAVTKEEREAIATQNLQKRLADTAPLKEEFVKFDKFKDGEFEYDVPHDYQSKLDGMFQAMFIDAGMDVTPENKEAITELRDALFLKQNFSKIREVIARQAQTEVQKKLDEALNNTKPPNTATATDEDSNRKDDLPGKSLAAFLTDQK